MDDKNSKQGKFFFNLKQVGEIPAYVPPPSEDDDDMPNSVSKTEEKGESSAADPIGAEIKKREDKGSVLEVVKDAKKEDEVAFDLKQVGEIP